MIDYIKVGKRIRKIRRSTKMTQKELSNKLNLSVGYICKAEKGLAVLKLDSIYKIAEIFRCDINWLIWGNDTDADGTKLL